MILRVSLIDFTGIDKMHLECDCIKDSIVNGNREPISNSFAISSPPGTKIYKEPRIKLFKRINKSALSDITFHLEDDDLKTVVFISDIFLVTCQFVKI